MQKSADFLRSIGCLTCKDAAPVETTASSRHPVGFDANLNARTSAPAPPRAIKTLSWDMVKNTENFLFFALSYAYSKIHLFDQA